MPVKLMKQSSVQLENLVDAQATSAVISFCVHECVWLFLCGYFCLPLSYILCRQTYPHMQKYTEADPHFSLRQFACLASEWTCLTLHVYMMTNLILNLLCLFCSMHWLLLFNKWLCFKSYRVLQEAVHSLKHLPSQQMVVLVRLQESECECGCIQTGVYCILGCRFPCACLYSCLCACHE